MSAPVRFRPAVIGPSCLWIALLGILTAPDPAHPQARDVPAELLSAVMPEADGFDDRSGTPPVFRAWVQDEAGVRALVGYVFHTVDVPPERRGYSGPIEALVGMDLDGRITGVRVTGYWESISSSMGDFLRERGVQEQFRGKHIAEAFSPRNDVVAVSGATISTRGLSLGVRDAARRVANAYLSAAIAEEDPLQPIEELSWFQLQQREVIVPMRVTGSGNEDVQISIAYMEHDPFALSFVGEDGAAMAKRFSKDGHPT